MIRLSSPECSAVADWPEASIEEKLLEADKLGKRAAAAVIARYGNSNVFEICKLAGVKLEYRRWALVTIGECEWRTPIIRINLAALDAITRTHSSIPRDTLEKMIMAHELGHVLLCGSLGAAPNPFGALAVHERFAHGFAAALLNLSAAEYDGVSLALRCAARQLSDRNELYG